MALAETLFAVFLYWVLAFAADIHWLLWLSVWSAPLLLLRSPQSVQLALALFRSVPRSRVLLMPTRARIRWGNAGFIYLGFSLLAVMARASEVKNSLISALWPHVLFLLILLRIQQFPSFGVWEVSKEAWIDAYEGLQSSTTTKSIEVAALLVFWVSSWKVLSYVEDRSFLVAYFYTFGILYVSFAPTLIPLQVIRVYSTLRYFRVGLLCIPNNYVDICARIRLFSPAEPLPGIGVFEPEFAVPGLFSKPSPGPIRTVFGVWPMAILGTAFLYRLSLKSTAWFWWPLWLLARPIDATAAQEGAIATARETISRVFFWLAVVGIFGSLLKHLDWAAFSELRRMPWFHVAYGLFVVDWTSFRLWELAKLLMYGLTIAKFALSDRALTKHGLGLDVKGIASAVVHLQRLSLVVLALYFSLGLMYLLLAMTNIGRFMNPAFLARFESVF